MWLITTWIAALLVTAIGFFASPRYKLGFLSLMLWGATVMILVDHILGYGGGELIETTPEALLVGIVMLIPVFTIWEVAVLISGKTGAGQSK